MTFSNKSKHKKRRKRTNKTKKISKTKRRPKYFKDNCAPKNKDDVLPFTCYTGPSLLKLKNIWNLKHPDQLITSSNHKVIWKNLKSLLSSSCDRESCWFKQIISENNIGRTMQDNFRPEAPLDWGKSPNAWLRSTDLIKVMKQYESIYKCFKFIGPSPIDYDAIDNDDNKCVWEELCKFNLSNYLKNNIHKIGIIFNLDPHYKGGSHWVALFIDTKKRDVYYFDSYSNKTERPPNQIFKFVKLIQNQAVDLNLKYDFFYNCTKHQYSNSECGMYCLYFIIKLLKGRNFHSLMKKRIEDRTVFKLRQKYFNHK